MRNVVRFKLDGAIHEVENPDPTLTVLRWLRSSGRVGTKEGCAEGDCGACTVALYESAPDVAGARKGAYYRAVNSCILFLPMIDGKTLVTVENLSAPEGPLHPVQQAMVETNGSQCGFCTPGFVMSLYAHYMNGGAQDPDTLRNVLAGNLCRCTGYGPIIEAGRRLKSRQEPEGVVFAQDPAPLGYSYEGDHGSRKFFSPRTLNELMQLAAAHPEAIFLAGSTDVGLWVTKKHQILKTVISVMAIAELHELKQTTEALEIGAAVTYSEAMATLSAFHPDLGELLRRLGSVQVRNAGTIGGNVANGSPIGDSPPPLIALGAKVVLRSVLGTRELDLDQYFLAYGKQDRRPGEFIEKIIVPRLQPDAAFRVYKVSKRFDQDISAVCGAFTLRQANGVVTEARVAFGGMAGIPKRAMAVERVLTGQKLSETSVALAMQAMESDFTPLTDMRASAAYRLKVAQNLLKRAWLEITGASDATRILNQNALAHE